MRATSFVALALGAACTRDVPAPAPARNADSPATSSAPVSATPPPAASTSAWLASADSALRLHLANELFLADGHYPPGMKDCSDDEGSDNPTLQVAAVALRPVASSGLSPDSSGEYPYVVKRTTFSVEVKSVAIMVPQWIARFTVDSTPVRDGEELYAGIIAPRVDTFSITLSQITGRFHVEDGSDVPDAGARWTVCDPGGPAVSEGDGPGFWGFAHARRKWMDIRRWTPADGSWDRIIALADSATRATSPP